MENRVISINTGIGLRKRCNIKNSFYPSVNPIIDKLSAYESKQNQFKEIYIYGSNFQYQNTYILVSLNVIMNLYIDDSYYNKINL